MRGRLLSGYIQTRVHTTTIFIKCGFGKKEKNENNNNSPTNCTGCRLCEIACSLKNAGECNPARSKIRVIGFDEMFPMPLMCLQCEKPFCAEICPSGAII